LEFRTKNRFVVSVNNRVKPVDIFWIAAFISHAAYGRQVMVFGNQRIPIGLVLF